MVGIVLAAGLLMGVFAGPLKVPEPPLGILVLKRRAAVRANVGLLAFLDSARRPCLRLVAGWNATAVLLVVCHVDLAS